METSIARTDWKPLETRTVSIGFLLAGLVIAVTAVSYLLNSPFPVRWLVWLIGVAFAAVALLALEWPRAFRRGTGGMPKGKLRHFLLGAMPLAFVLDSQLCGLGLKACTVVCHVISFAMIGLAAGTALQLHRDKPVGALLIPMIVIALIPHCVCQAPINTLWHGMLGGIAPTCQVMPLAATLFSVAAVRGVRPRYGAALVAVLLVVITFIAVSNPLFGFPWEGCVS